MNYDKCSIGSDLECMSDNWEDEQEALAAWHREQQVQEEAEDFFDTLEREEERNFRDHYQPWTGTTLNGHQLLIDVETGEICDSDGNPLNSCDSLAVIDGCTDEEE